MNICFFIETQIEFRFRAAFSSPFWCYDRYSLVIFQLCLLDTKSAFSSFIDVMCLKYSSVHMLPNDAVCVNQHRPFQFFRSCTLPIRVGRQCSSLFLVGQKASTTFKRYEMSRKRTPSNVPRVSMPPIQLIARTTSS